MCDLPHACSDITRAIDDVDTPVVYVDKLREYGIAIGDGGSSYLVLRYCPFCGAALPASLRDAWFDRLEADGRDPGDADLPSELRDGTWWRDP